MNYTLLRQRSALCLLLILLASSFWLGLVGDGSSWLDKHDWVHVFCVTHAVLVAGLISYGPGRLIVRLPFAVAWAIALGGVLSKENLISIPGTASIGGGCVLAATGLCSSLAVLSLERWRNRGYLSCPWLLSDHRSSQPTQLSIRTLMMFVFAFAVAGTIGRVVATTTPDPYGHESQILFFHAWLGTSICLSASLVVIAVFNPRQTAILLGLFVAIVLIDPGLFPIVANKVLVPQNMFPQNYFMQHWELSLAWHGQGAIAIGIYTILARATGLKMIYPDHSNETKPKPSGDPATDAGCVQD